MPRFIAVCFLLLLAPGVQSPVAHATPTALVMNGIDNTISTADLTTGAVQLGPHAFAGFPSEAVVKAGKLYVVVSGADAVEVLDTATLTLLQTLSTGAGSNPYALDVDDAGNVYVSLLNTHELVRFDATGTETGRVGVGGSPEDVLLLNGVCYVANTGFRPSDFGYDPGTVFALDPGTLAITDTLAVGMNPQWLAAWNNDLHVMCTGNYFSVFGEAHVIDGATHAPQDTLVLGGSPGKIAIGDGLAVTTDYFGGLYTYDADTRTVIRDSGNALLVGGTGYTGLAFDGMGNLLFTLFADDLLVRLRLSDEQVIDTYATGDGPGCLAVHEDKPVPVQLTTFSVEATEAGVRLDWTLGDVHEASRIQVERSGAQPTGEPSRTSLPRKGVPGATRTPCAGRWPTVWSPGFAPEDWRPWGSAGSRWPRCRWRRAPWTTPPAVPCGSPCAASRERPRCVSSMCADGCSCPATGWPTVPSPWTPPRSPTASTSFT